MLIKLALSELVGGGELAKVALACLPGDDRFAGGAIYGIPSAPPLACRSGAQLGDFR
jgi:hypothetical protein